MCALRRSARRPGQGPEGPKQALASQLHDTHPHPPPPASSRIGAQGDQPDLHGLCILGEPQLSSKGAAIALADGSAAATWHISPASGGQEFSRRLLLGTSMRVGQDVGRAGARRHQPWLMPRRDAQPLPRGPESRLCAPSAPSWSRRRPLTWSTSATAASTASQRRAEQLTNDHRLIVSETQSYLAGAGHESEALEIDYHAVPIEEGDIHSRHRRHLRVRFGVLHHRSGWRHADCRISTPRRGELPTRPEPTAAPTNPDHPDRENRHTRHGAPRPASTCNWPSCHMAPVLEPRMVFDGYRIVRAVHGSSRSHIYLAEDGDGGACWFSRSPSIDLRDDPAYRERFMLGEWIARRINSAHVLKPCPRRESAITPLRGHRIHRRPDAGAMDA